ncbi:MAG: S-layer homology domain-containing protein, partial [Syntrophomonas sp.]
MKRLLILFIAISLVITPLQVWAAPTEFCGGVNNEYEYQEIVFITGEPIKFTGTVDIKETEKADSKTVSYKFNLTSEDKTLKGKLARTMKYQVSYSKRDDKGQTIAQMEVDSRPSETITIGKDKYILKDYQFSKSDVIDNRPASDYYNGTISGRKYYSINNTEGTVTVDISGGNVGYENFWGSTETQILDNVINYERETTDKDGTTETSWQGTIRTQTADSTTKTLKYADNEATYSSFSGGNMRVTNQEMVSRYEYDLPEVTDGVPDDESRNQDTVQLTSNMLPKVERLILPKFRDVAGHWAQQDIEKLYSLDVFQGGTQFFLPDIAMT